MKIIGQLAEFILRKGESYRENRKRVIFNIKDSVRVVGVSLEGTISIGQGTYINPGSRIDSGVRSSISIGEFCAIGRYVHITSKTHSFFKPTTSSQGDSILHIEDDVIIGSHVWMGDNVYIGPGITIEDYAIIGANSVVTKDVAKYEIVGGVPAKHIRFNTEHESYSK